MLYLSEPNKCFIESGRLLIHIDKNHRFPPGNLEDIAIYLSGHKNY